MSDLIGKHLPDVLVNIVTRDYLEHDGVYPCRLFSEDGVNTDVVVYQRDIPENHVPTRLQCAEIYVNDKTAVMFLLTKHGLFTASISAVPAYSDVCKFSKLLDFHFRENTCSTVTFDSVIGINGYRCNMFLPCTETSVKTNDVMTFTFSKDEITKYLVWMLRSAMKYLSFRVEYISPNKRAHITEYFNSEVTGQTILKKARIT